MAEPTIAEQQEQFSEVAGQFLDGLLKRLAQYEVAKTVEAAATEGLGTVLGVAVRAMAPIGIGIAKGIAASENVVAPALADMAAAAVNDMFGTNVPPSTFSGGMRQGGREGAATALGKGLLEQLTGTTGELKPDDTAAARYLTFIVNMALEGWYQKWFFEFLSSLIPQLDVGKIENYGCLDDKMSQALGLGRLTRRVLSPLIDATIVTPTEWKTNLTYRPQLLAASEAVRQFVRGRKPREWLDEELGKQGYSPERIEALIFSNTRRHSEADVGDMIEEELITDDLAVTMLQQLGYEELTARSLVHLWQLRRIRSGNKAAITAVTRAFVDRDITEGTYDRVLRTLEPNETLRGGIKHAALAQREYNVKRLSHGEIKEAVSRGILNRMDYRRWLEREGYPPDDALTLELLLDDQLKGEREARELRAQREAERLAEQERRAREAAERKAAIEAKRARTFPSLADLERAVIRGILPIGAYEARLADLKYAADDIATLSALLQQDRDRYAEDQERRARIEGETADRDLSAAQLERAALRGVITPLDYRMGIAAMGYDDREVGILGALLDAELADRRRAAEEKARAAAELQARGLSLPQSERLVRQGIWSLGNYQGFLLEQGFARETAALLAASLSQELADAAADAERRAALEAAAEARGVSLAQLARAVKLDVRDISEYERALIELGYSADDQVTLLGILRAELAQLAAARAKRNQPAPNAGIPPDARANLEAAVLAGTATLADYRAALATFGYTPDDIELFAQLLLLELQDARLSAA